jgi:hypothetical protein
MIFSNTWFFLRPEMKNDFFEYFSLFSFSISSDKIFNPPLYSLKIILNENYS